MLKTIIQISKYLSLTVTGLLLVLLASVLQKVNPPRAGEYYYSGFLINNYTALTAGLFFVAGLMLGSLLKLRPWVAGISLVLIFPLVSVYEATVYRGSHNLFPAELFIYFLYSLPGIAGLYLGKWFNSRRQKPGHGSNN